MNLLGGKITNFLGVSTSVSIFMAPLTFLITDIVEEVFGRKITRNFVIAGVIVLIVLLAYTALFVQLPPAERFTFDSEYKIIFGNSLRMLAASIIAFAISQLHDVWAFNFWKTKTRCRFLWLRNNLSTAVSQTIDTFIFMFIAFYHLTPKFDALFVIQLSIPYLLLKLFFAVLDTPFVYLGVWWLRGEKAKTE